MSRVVKSAKQLSAEFSAEQGHTSGTDYVVAFARLSAVVETFLWFADDCNDLEQLKKYVKTGFDSVTEEL